MADLLPAEMGFLRVGGESGQQLSEYHRGMRLADTVRGAAQKLRTPPAEKLDEETALPLFATWRAEHRPDAEQPDDGEELLAQLMESWASGSGIAFLACSPHRIAAKVASIQDYYDDEYAADLVALLPDWVAFLFEYNGTPPDLMERCLAVASGAPYPGVGRDNYQSASPRLSTRNGHLSCRRRGPTAAARRVRPPAGDRRGWQLGREDNRANHGWLRLHRRKA